MATAGASSPLSGPTSTEAPSPTSTATARRVGADAGVDHGEHDAGARYWALRARRQATGPHVVGRDLVGEVDHDDRRARSGGSTDFTTPTNSSAEP